MKNKINIINVGTGNIGSIISALKKLKINFKLVENVENIDSNKLILPGVGAFKDFMKRLKKKKFDIFFKEKLNNEIKILGICVGFQALFSRSSEGGNERGLDLINGNIEKFKTSLPIPHVGWNSCKIVKKNLLFKNINNYSDFYFTHSYHLKKCDKKNILTTTNYDGNFVSSINQNQIFGVQFHPEKSQLSGLQIFKNFSELD